MRSLSALLLLLSLTPGLARSQGTGSISGSVSGPAGDLLPATQVMALPADSSRGGDGSGFMAPVDPDGQYRIDGLEPDTYVVLAFAPDFAPQFYDNAAERADATPVTVGEGEEVAGIDFALKKPGEGASSIGGSVRDTAGLGVPGATVSGWSRSAAFPFRVWAVADSEGHYSIDRIQGGEFWLEAMAEGYVSGPPVGTNPVILEDGAALAGVDFELAAAGGISGTISDSLGQGLADLTIRVESLTLPSRDSTYIHPDGTIEHGGNPVIAVTSTDAEGSYSFRSLPPDFYRMAVSGARHGFSGPDVWYPGVSDPAEADSLIVVEGEVLTGIDMQLALLAGEGSISGRITDENGVPQADVFVEATPFWGGVGGCCEPNGDCDPNGCCELGGGCNPGGSGMPGESGDAGGSDDPSGSGDAAGSTGWGGWATTDADGYYRISELPAGEYVLSAWVRSDDMVSAVWWPAGDRSGALPVPVSPGEDSPGYDFELTAPAAPGSMSGRVTSTEGDPLPGAYVQVIGQSAADGGPRGSWAQAVTDSSGFYLFDHLRPGEYQLFAQYSEGDFYGQAWYPSAENQDAAERVRVASDSLLEGIDLLLPVRALFGTVAGIVVDAATGLPVERALVEVQWRSASESGRDGFFRAQLPYALTGPDGRFEISGLPESEYLVSATSDGAFAYLGGAYVPELADPVKVAGGSVTEIEIRLEGRNDGPGAISGLVLAEAWMGWPDSSFVEPAPLPHSVIIARPTVSIALWPDSERFYSTLADPDGFYVLGGLPDGEYLVAARGPEHIGLYYDGVFDPSEASPVVVSGGGRAEHIDFSLLPMYMYALEDGLGRSAGVVHGHVQDENGAPVSGATVLAVDASGNPVGSAVTDADGAYSIAGLPPGEYRFMVSKPGHDTSYNGNAESVSDAVPVALTGDSTELDLTLGVPASTDREITSDLPGRFVLRGNYPNPFNPVTTVVFDLPSAARISVEVVDLLGRRLLASDFGAMDAGAARSIRVDASSLPSGVYLYRVSARGTGNPQVATGRMVVMK